MHSLVQSVTHMALHPDSCIHWFMHWPAFIQSASHPIQSVIQFVSFHSLVLRFVRSFTQFISFHFIHSYLADDSGAKRKYRELKRLPADIRAQVALLKVLHFTCTVLKIPPPPPPSATFQPLLGNICRI